MKYALIADLHGNKPAIQRLEKDLLSRKVDAVICLGDVVGKGPNNDFAFDWVKSNCDIILQGNWEQGICARTFENDVFYHEQLGENRLKEISAWPLEHRLRLSGKNIRLIHGRPIFPALHRQFEPEEVWAEYFLPDYHVLIYADSHRQGMRTLSHKLLVNTGSVGNSLGVAHVQYLIMEGSVGNDSAPLDFIMVNLSYNNQATVEEALKYPNLYNHQAFIQEIQTGIYSGQVSNKKNR